MKIRSSITGNTYDFYPSNRNSEERYTCPECSHNRKKIKDKCFAWDVSNSRGYCHNCLSAFFEDKPIIKTFVIPEWKNKTDLTDNAVKWFNGRMISQETLTKMKVYSDTEFMPQYGSEKPVICFPYFKDDIQVNIKFRGPEKSFKMVKDAELTWYNYDCIKNFSKLFIVEGEIDALTFIENGFDNVVSVPNGASNFEFLDPTINLFDHVESIFLAVDVDAKGILLRDELLRRFGPERCNIVDFEDCKDANEYFVKYGGIKFKDLKSIPAPVKGIVKVSDLNADLQNYIKNGLPQGLEINIPEIDEFIKWQTGLVAVVTGVPSSGKSEFIDYLTVRFNLLFGWKCAYFTPENYPLIVHVSKLFDKIAGRSLNSCQDFEREAVIDYIDENFFYILDEEDLSVKKILESAKILVKTKGIRVLVVDPYNTIDHQYDKHTPETKYISDFLKQLSLFAKFNNVLVFLIAHPAKMQNGEIPSLYSISGSAHFYNKADYGIIVHREHDHNNLMTNETSVYWKKIRFRHLGKQGITKLRHNYNNGRYESVNSVVDYWDNTNWLVKETIKPEIYERPPF